MSQSPAESERRTAAHRSLRKQTLTGTQSQPRWETWAEPSLGPTAELTDGGSKHDDESCEHGDVVPDPAAAQTAGQSTRT